MKSSAPLVSVNNFQMKFGDKTVIDNLNFTIGHGETFGLLGSNGSGKTTTIRALLGIYRPTAGTLRIGGAPYTVDGDVRLGYLPEERGLYKKESVIDTMNYFGQLKGLSRHAAQKWSMEFLERVQLEKEARTRLDKLSGGQQQKIQVGIAIMNDPKLIILDEPTKGFDPVNRRLLMDIIEERQQQGTTVIFVTHQMEEVERLCDRIMLLKNGERRLYGTIEEVKSEFGDKIIEIISDKAIPQNNKLYVVKRKEGRITFIEPRTDSLMIQRALLQAGIAFQKFEVKQPSLDDIFVTIYGERAEESHA